MTFNSLAFVWFFLIVTTTYFLLPQRVRWVWLAVASCFFYMYWSVWLIWIILLTVSIDYFAALGMERYDDPRVRRALLMLSVAGNIGILAVFKYSNFFIQSVNDASSSLGTPLGLALPDLVLPIGISFHTFQALSYTIDVYRRAIPVERHYGLYLLYVLFYPQLVSGPIERASNFMPQMREAHRLEYDRVASGLKQMLWGFFKKCAIADSLAAYVNTVYAHPHDHGGFPLLLGTYFFAFQIYCDFSGYTDIAIGAAKVMGFNLMKNFDRPYIAASVSEFWRRWHISLSTWFRDYVYKPLGGSRGSALNQAFAVMTVFLLSGLWHGASWTYVVWGAIHGLYLLLERLFKDLPLPRIPPAWSRAIGIVITFHLVCIGWVFFRASTIADACFILTHMGFSQHSVPLKGSESNLLIASIVLLLLVESRMGRRTFDAYLQDCRPAWRWAWATGLIVAILLMMPAKPSTFIYFQF